jgi:hypothetical protein
MAAVTTVCIDGVDTIAVDCGETVPASARASDWENGSSTSSKSVLSTLTVAIESFRPMIV